MNKASDEAVEMTICGFVDEHCEPVLRCGRGGHKFNTANIGGRAGRGAGAAALEREPGDDTEIIKQQRAASRNNGREVVTASQRREVKRAFGIVVRFTDRIGRHAEFREDLNALAEAIEEIEV
jgi:hypothetical protein